MAYIYAVGNAEKKGSHMEFLDFRDGLNPVS
jgi:hypothetical protein